MSARFRHPEAWERVPLREVAAVIDDLRRRCAACPPAGMLSAAAVRALPPETLADIQVHIDSCPACLALRADLEQPDPGESRDEKARGLLSQPEPTPEGRWSWAVWLSVPASAAAVLTWIVFSQPAGAPPTVSTVAPRSVESTSANPSPIVRRRIPRLTKPEVKLTMLALTWRSAGDRDAGFAADVAPGLNAFRADRFEESRRHLAGLASRYPSSVEIPFYQGVSELYLGLHGDSVTTLRRAERLADATFAADAAWYLGIALARAGKPTEARARFASICKGGTSHAAAACEAAR